MAPRSALSMSWPSQRPRPLRAVLFDFDGVIADTEPFGLKLDREAYEALDVDVSYEDSLRIVGTDVVGVVEAIFAKYGHPELGAKDFLANHRDPVIIYEELLQEPMAGARELLVRLRARSLKVGLVSTTPAKSLLFALDRLGLLPMFDVVVGGDMVARRKPAPDPWLCALSFLGVSATEAVAIDDSPTGIASAKAAGLYVVGFKGGAIVQDTSAANEELASLAAFDLW